MSYVLSNISAFRYHRIPPQILVLCPPIPDEDCDRQRLRLRQDLLVNHVLGFPLHTLVLNRKERTNPALIEHHLWSSPLPPKAIWETDHGVQLVSPLFTLLTVVPYVSETRLLMMAYEMCGAFAVFKPSDLMEKALKDAYESHQMPKDYGWRRSSNQKGEATNLWQRPPLIQLNDLLDFAESNRGLRGGKKLLNAARRVSGITASPFEVQASILLGLSRRLGGEGLSRFENNYEIALDQKAKKIVDKEKVYADLHFVSADGERSVIVECQGATEHGKVDAGIRDADRVTALQSMGYDVVLLTFKKMSDKESFHTVAEMLANKLGYPYRAKTEAMKARESDLRRELLIDWATLGKF